MVFASQTFHLSTISVVGLVPLLGEHMFFYMLYSFFDLYQPPPESQIQNSKKRKSQIQTSNNLQTPKSKLSERRGQRHAKAPFFIKCPNQQIYIQGFEVPQTCFQTTCCLQNAIPMPDQHDSHSLWNAWTALPSVQASIFIKWTTSISFQSRLDTWIFFFNSGLPFIKWGLAEAFYSDKGSPFHKGMYEGYV